MILSFEIVTPSLLLNILIIPALSLPAASYSHNSHFISIRRLSLESSRISRQYEFSSVKTKHIPGWLEWPCVPWPILTSSVCNEQFHLNENLNLQTWPWSSLCKAGQWCLKATKTRMMSQWQHYSPAVVSAPVMMLSAYWSSNTRHWPENINSQPLSHTTL